MIEAAQIRAARALLGLGQVELAELAELGINTVKRVELSEEVTGSARTLWKIQTALEWAGVEFIPADETKGPGVRLKHRTGRHAKRSRARAGGQIKGAEGARRSTLTVGRSRKK
jgi:transcriptional regulator with XRE-family HTH domain